MILFDQHSAPRIEAGLKVTGTACYAAETSVEGVLHAALVVAPIASGRVLSIDPGRARSIPGIVEILTHETTLRISRPGFVAKVVRFKIRLGDVPVKTERCQAPGQAKPGAC